MKLKGGTHSKHTQSSSSLKLYARVKKALFTHAFYVLKIEKQPLFSRRFKYSIGFFVWIMKIWAKSVTLLLILNKKILNLAKSYPIQLGQFSAKKKEFLTLKFQIL